MDIMLPNKWTLYHHDSANNDWSISGYEVVMQNIDNACQIVTLGAYIPDKTICHTMWFLMQNSIEPRWEDPANINGGYLQYRVTNKFVPETWRILMQFCAGGLLDYSSSIVDSSIVDSSIVDSIVSPTGISISSRKTFCMIKIWFGQVFTGEPYKCLHEAAPHLLDYSGNPIFIKHKN